MAACCPSWLTAAPNRLTSADNTLHRWLRASRTDSSVLRLGLVRFVGERVTTTVVATTKGHRTTNPQHEEGETDWRCLLVLPSLQRSSIDGLWVVFECEIGVYGRGESLLVQSPALVLACVSRTEGGDVPAGGYV